MEIDYGPSSFNLPRDGVVLLHEADGARVTCVSGALWVTQEGHDEDVILEAGDSLRVSRAGLTLVTALRGSELRVTKPCTSGRALLRRLLAWLPAPLARASHSL